MNYRARIVDRELDELLPAVAAVALEGPKAVGKTATGQRRARTVFALDEPAVVQLLHAGWDTLAAADAPVLIDEWQRYPDVWDWVRRQVDAGAGPGRFVLAGSAIPVLVPSHSGAGRILSLRMRPMSLNERELSSATVSLADLLSGSRAPVEGRSGVSLTGYVEEIVRSGLPGIRDLTGRARRAQLDSYLERVVSRDFPEQGLAVRRPRSLRAWLSAYAAATATTSSYNKILDAATPGESAKPARTTATGYRDVLDQLYLLDPVPAWLPSRNRFAKLSQAPKHHLADPALAARLLGLDADVLLRDGKALGALFESLVTLSVRTYAQANEARVGHFRTRDGLHEADLVVERADGRVVAFEVKLTATADDAAAGHLRWLAAKLGGDLLDSVLITTGTHAYRRPDGIAVVPAALLGP